ncbi:MAG: urea ABC transporter ATP-binding protein UrtD [Anaerolineae bacterium]|nr:urea ABC transporter ATP-binding protein UrtD [Anaerolineae bacterium]
MSSGKILEVKEITVGFDGFTVLNRLDFSMNRGELRFLIGPNGAGKTTLMDIITGKTRPSSGQIIFDERVDVRRFPEHRLVQQGIGRKFQTPSIFPSLSVFENLEVAIGFKAATAKLVQALPNTQEARIWEALEKVGLKERAEARAGLLSHGEKQWLEIGMLIVQQPKLLLLDEPVAGMTRRERDRTGELLQTLSGEHSVLVVEHDMQFVRQFASTVTVLHLGKTLCEGPVEMVQNDPRVIEVYLGPGRAKHGTKTALMPASIAH